MANPVWHWELMVNDVAKARGFYGAVFGWQFDDTRFSDYTLIDTGRDPSGGMMVKPPASPRPTLNTYFEVDDIDRTLRAVVEAGGNVVVPRTEIAGVGWYGLFLDPDRITVGILQPK
jgi:predicted enzyme related to lactoylglutathione lyase